MSLKRLALQMAMRRNNGFQTSLMTGAVVPKSAIFASRLGMTNRYAHDYACEDEYFEKEMTMYEAKTMHLPLPTTHKHKDLPMDDVMPPHWNDVRFNFKP